MTDGFRTCPNCLMRVAPLPDGQCPSCRRFNFNESPSDKQTVQAARAAAKASARARIRRAANLHWQVIGSGVTGVVLALISGYVSAGSGEGQLDRSRVVRLLSIAASAAIAAAVQRASALANEIRLASGGARTPGIFTVLKSSMAFFEENHVPVGPFGPRMSEMSEEDQAAE